MTRFVKIIPTYTNVHADCWQAVIKYIQSLRMFLLLSVGLILCSKNKSLKNGQKRQLNVIDFAKCTFTDIHSRSQQFWKYFQHKSNTFFSMQYVGQLRYQSLSPCTIKVIIMRSLLKHICPTYGHSMNSWIDRMA